MRPGIVLVMLLASTPAMARPGFYIDLGAGAGFTSGPSALRLGRIQGLQSNGSLPATFLRTSMSTAPAVTFRLGYNILGYAAIEAGASGQGTDVSNADKRAWTAAWTAGVRAYPLWYWQHRLPHLVQPLEPSIFLGLGMSWAGYVPTPGSDDFGWRSPVAFRGGIGLEYFVLSFLKVGLDYTYVMAPYGTFIYNASQGEELTVKPAASTGYNQLVVTVGFQFSPQAAPAPAAPVPMASPTAAPTPVAPPVVAPQPPPAAAPATPAKPKSTPAATPSDDGGTVNI